MATKKISELIAGVTITDTDQFEVVQGGNSRRVSGAQFKAFLPVARRVAVLIGNASDASFTVAHGFGTRRVRVEVVRNGAPYDTVITDVKRPDVNNVIIEGFLSAPAVDEYEVLISE